MKKITSIGLTAIILFLIIAGNVNNVSASEVFSDVNDRSKSYYIPVYWAVENDIAKGFSDGTFRPADICTRAQFVTFLWRMAGRPSANNGNIFSDVNRSMSSYKAILWAVSKGIIVGYKDGTFRPNETVLRRQVAVMLWRWAGKPRAASSVNSFADIAPNASYYKAVLWGHSAGVMKGSKGNFMPADLCQRQQVVTFLYRYNRELLSDKSPYRMERLEAINLRGQKIVGDIYIPRKPKGKTVILCHGLGGSRAGMMIDYAEALAKEGYICYAFDFCGGGLESQSDGNMLDMTVLTEVEDLEAVFKMISDLYYVDLSQIYIAGHSQGALVEALFSAKHPDLPAGLIQLSSAFVIPDWIRISFPYYNYIPASYYLFDNSNWYLGRKYAQEIYYMDPYTQCRGYDKKVLILHGKEDTGVSYTDAYDIAAIYPQSKLIIYEYADHMIEGSGARNQSYRDIIAFLN